MLGVLLGFVRLAARVTHVTTAAMVTLHVVWWFLFAMTSTLVTMAAMGSDTVMGGAHATLVWGSEQLVELGKALHEYRGAAVLTYLGLFFKGLAAAIDMVQAMLDARADGERLDKATIQQSMARALMWLGGAIGTAFAYVFSAIQEVLVHLFGVLYDRLEPLGAEVGAAGAAGIMFLGVWFVLFLLDGGPRRLFVSLVAMALRDQEQAPEPPTAPTRRRTRSVSEPMPQHSPTNSS